MSSQSKLNQNVAIVLLGVLLLFMLLVVFFPTMPFLLSGGKFVLFVGLLYFSGKDVYRTFHSPAGTTSIRALSIASIICVVLWMVALTFTPTTSLGVLTWTGALPLSLVLSIMAQRRLREHEQKSS